MQRGENKKLEHLIKFAVDEFQKINFEDYDSKEFAIARMGFLSTKPNSHGLEISEEVLKNYASTVLGKWVVAKMFNGDATTHLPDEQIMGNIPRDQEVEFVYDEDGYLGAYVDAVISKIYAKDFCNMFEDDNKRAVSVEMKIATENGNDTNDVVNELNIVGVTTLGKNVNPSCPESDITFVRFAEDQAQDYFKSVHKDSLATLKKFAKERKEEMAEKTYKVDKSKDAMSDKPWGEVDKIDLRNKIMEASNKATLVKAVYMLVEDGWEDAPSEHLKYPVMELRGDTFVYNRDGLASALGYAKKENETAVVNKVMKIYKSLGLTDEEGKEETKMAEIEFAAVNIDDMWCQIYRIMRDERHNWNYYIRNIYEEDNQKFAIIYDDEHKLYRLDFSLTEEGMTLADEIVEVKEEFVETENMVKFAEPENVEQYRNFAKTEEPTDEEEDGKETKMSADEMIAKIAELEAQISERDNIIMENNKELDGLRKFQADYYDNQKALKVEETMQKYAQFMEKETAQSFRTEGMECKFSEVDAWMNKVKASVVDKVMKGSPSTNVEFTRIAGVDNTIIKKSNNIWDEL